MRREVEMRMDVDGDLAVMEDVGERERPATVGWIDDARIRGLELQ